MLIRILNILFCIFPQYVERILDNMANNFNEAFAGGKMIPKRLRIRFASISVFIAIKLNS